MSEKNNSKFHTLAIHAGEPRPPLMGSVNLPVFTSTTYEYFGKESGDLPKYIRLHNTPNQVAVTQKIAALEGAEASLVATTGMAAISAALLTCVGPGEHFIAQDNLYGGAYQFLTEDFPRLGRTVSFFNTDDHTDLKNHLTPNTRAIYVESVSNPLTKIPNLPAVIAWAKENKLVSLIDNTFLSPVNFQPIKFGFDVVLHSGTKYLNGHTDVMAGCASGSRSVIEKIQRLLSHLGGSLDPMSCYLLNRGLKTLAVRVPYQNRVALLLASQLEKHPKIKKVYYPGLASHPNHSNAREWFKEFGGMFSFEFAGPVSEADAFLKRLKIAYIAPSLGGVETLVTRPSLTSHSWMSQEERKRAGILDTLIRVSIGLEDPDDLTHDFVSALGGN